MFDSLIYSELSSDSGVAGVVSNYSGTPAIFNHTAPETADTPYLLFRITEDLTGSRMVKDFDVYFDYYLSSGSRENIILLGKRLEGIFDGNIFTHPDYDSIRLWFQSSGDVPETDPREIHYNWLFSARAGRKAWSAD
jgi:hypothetical protein